MALKSTQLITNIKNILDEENIHITGYKYKKEINNDKYIFTPISEGFFYVNSFVPVIEIVLSKALDGTLIEINFKLIRGVKSIFIALLLIGIVFQISLVIYCFKIKIDNILIAFIPLLWIVLLLVMEYIGLRLSSKKIVKKIKRIIDE